MPAGEARVYEVSGLPEYVLRVPKGWAGDSADWGPFKAVEDPFPGMNVGQPVARMGDVLLIKYQPGILGGVPEDVKSGEEADTIYEKLS